MNNNDLSPEISLKLHDLWLRPIIRSWWYVSSGETDRHIVIEKKEVFKPGFTKTTGNFRYICPVFTRQDLEIYLDKDFCRLSDEDLFDKFIEQYAHRKITIGEGDTYGVQYRYGRYTSTTSI